MRRAREIPPLGPDEMADWLALPAGGSVTAPLVDLLRFEGDHWRLVMDILLAPLAMFLAWLRRLNRGRAEEPELAVFLEPEEPTFLEQLLDNLRDSLAELFAARSEQGRRQLRADPAGLAILRGATLLKVFRWTDVVGAEPLAERLQGRPIGRLRLGSETLYLLNAGPGARILRAAEHAERRNAGRALPGRVVPDTALSRARLPAEPDERGLSPADA